MRHENENSKQCQCEGGKHGKSNLLRVGMEQWGLVQNENTGTHVEKLRIRDGSSGALSQVWSRLKPSTV